MTKNPAERPESSRTVAVSTGSNQRARATGSGPAGASVEVEVGLDINVLTSSIKGLYSYPWVRFVSRAMTDRPAARGSTRGRPTAAQVAARRQSAVDAMRVLLEERGAQGATMGAVAERAGVSKESLYTWFGEKQGLLAALIEANAQVMNARVQSAIERPEAPRAVLVAFATDLLSLLTGPASVSINGPPWPRYLAIRPSPTSSAGMAARRPARSSARTSQRCHADGSLWARSRLVRSPSSTASSSRIARSRRSSARIPRPRTSWLGTPRRPGCLPRAQRASESGFRGARLTLPASGHSRWTNGSLRLQGRWSCRCS